MGCLYCAMSSHLPNHATLTCAACRRIAVALGRACPYLFKLLCSILVLRLSLNQATQLLVSLELVFNLMLQLHAFLSSCLSHCLSVGDPTVTACRLVGLMLLHAADAGVMAYGDTLWAHRVSAALCCSVRWGQ